jgi:hypothetical protein
LSVRDVVANCSSLSSRLYTQNQKQYLTREPSLKHQLDAKGWDVYRHQYFGGMGPNGSGAFPMELETVVEIVQGFEKRGIVVKGIEQGLIDFPHIRENGEEVYLCWMVGENDIAYWHTIEGGFAGRKGIEEL